MILGSTLAQEAELTDPTPFMFFPLVVHAMDIIVSSLGILYVGASSANAHHKDPMTILKGGYYVTAVSRLPSHPWLSQRTSLHLLTHMASLVPLSFYRHAPSLVSC